MLAVVQTDVKRMLAYSSISHAGYVLIGLQAATDQGIAGSLFYLLAYTFMILGSFAIVTMVGRQGDGRHALDDYRGLARNRPGLALAFTVFLLAQAGVPFTSGFLAKFGVIAAAVESRSYALAVIAMVAAVIAAFFYLRVIVVMYMSGDPDDEPAATEESGPDGSAADGSAPTTAAGDATATATATRTRVAIPLGAGVAVALCLAFTIGAGLLPEPLLDFARHATLLKP